MSYGPVFGSVHNLPNVPTGFRWKHIGGCWLMGLYEISTTTAHKILFLPIIFALTSPSLVGTGKVVVGLTTAYPCSYPWNGRRRMDVKSRMLHADDTGVMIQLKLVKTSVEEANEPEEEDGALNHGTKVLLRLVRPWLRTDRLVCADSYFASVQTAKELLRVGLRFIGVVKTATRMFPMAHLASKELSDRGDRYGVICNNENNNNAELLAFVWVDRD